MFLFCAKLEYKTQGRTFIVHNSNFIFWWGWCSGSHWRQFHWFRSSEFIWEHRLSINNQAVHMNIFFSKWYFRRKMKSGRVSAHLHFWMPVPLLRLSNLLLRRSVWSGCYCYHHLVRKLFSLDTHTKTTTEGRDWNKITRPHSISPTSLHFIEGKPVCYHIL